MACKFTFGELIIDCLHFVTPSCLTVSVNNEGGPIKNLCNIYRLTSLFLRQWKTKMKNPCGKLSEHKNIVDAINKIKYKCTLSYKA